MKKYEDCRSMEVFQFTPRKFEIQTWLCNCPQYLCLFHTVFECSPSLHDQQKMLVLPASTPLLSTFHIGTMFCFFPAKLTSSTYADKNNPFSRCTNKHSQVETFSQPDFKRMFSNCLTNDNPAKRRPYRFRSRGTTGSSILDHDLGHLCRGRRIQMSGHSEFWSFQ